MSTPIDPKRLELAREYARARRSDRLAATLTELLSEVLADRDRLAAAMAGPLVTSMSLTAEDLVQRAVSSAGHGETAEWPRWSWVARIFSVGSTSAAALCRHFGFDPDEPRGRDDSHEDDGPIEPEVLADLLSLVMQPCPTPETIATWTDEDRRDVEAWASHAHLQACDNLVTMPPRPAVLDCEVDS